MKKTNLLIAALLLTISFSCKKSSSDSSSSSSASGCLTTAVKSGSITYLNMAYDGSRNLSRISQYDSQTGALSNTTDYTYSGSNVTKQTSTSYNNGSPSSQGYVTYEYNGMGGKLSKQNNYDANGQYTGYTVYTYDGTSGQCTKTQSFSNTDAPGNYSVYAYTGGKLSSITTWDYTSGHKGQTSFYDNSGNVTSISNYEWLSASATYAEHIVYQFGYDNTKKNYLSPTMLKVLMVPVTIPPANALTSVKNFDPNTGQLVNDATVEYDSNNTNGYPTVIKVTNNAVVTLYNVEYSCN